MAKDSAAAKAARVKLQLRDKHGQWIEMGGGAKWIDKKSNAPEAGTIVGFDGNYVLVAQKPANATAEPAPMRIPVGSLETYKIKGNLDPYYKSQIDKFLGNMSKNDKQELEAREKAVTEGKKAELDGKPDLVKEFIEIFDEDDDTDGKFEKKMIKLSELKHSNDRNFKTSDGAQWYRPNTDIVFELGGEGETISKKTFWSTFEQKYVNSPDIEVVDASVLKNRSENFKAKLAEALNGASITDSEGNVWTKDADGDFTNGKVLNSGVKAKPSVLRFHSDISKIEFKYGESATPEPKAAPKVSVTWPNKLPEAGKYKLEGFVPSDDIQPGQFVHLNSAGNIYTSSEYADFADDVTGKIGYVTDSKPILGKNKTSMGKTIGTTVKFIDEDGNEKTADLYATSPNNKYGKNGVFAYDPNKSEETPVEGPTTSEDETATPEAEPKAVIEEVATDTNESESSYAKDVPAAQDVAPNQIVKSGVVLTPLADVEEGEEILAFKYAGEHPPKTPFSLSALKLDEVTDEQFGLDESIASTVVGKKTPGKYAAVALPDGKTGYLGMTTLVVKASDNGKGAPVATDEPKQDFEAQLELLNMQTNEYTKKLESTDSVSGLFDLLNSIRLNMIQDQQQFGGPSGAKSEAQKVAGSKLIDSTINKLKEDATYSIEQLDVVGALAKNGYGNPVPNQDPTSIGGLIDLLDTPEGLNAVRGALANKSDFKKSEQAFEGKNNADMISSENLNAFKRYKSLTRSLSKLDKALAEENATPENIEIPESYGIDPTQPIDVTSWTKLSGPQGSNPGGIYQDEKGNKWYVKQSKSDEHAKNEVLADMIYTETGINVAGLRLADVGGGKLGTASPMIEGAKNNLSQMLYNSTYIAKIREGFAVDALLANWDVVGLVFDNVVTDANGLPVRVDPGGAMKFRAQGGLKSDLNPKFWAGEVLDWDSLRDPNVGTAAKIYEGITDEQMIASANRVEAISPEMIDEMVSKLNMDSADAEILKARREDIIAKRDALKGEDESPVVEDDNEVNTVEESSEPVESVEEAPVSDVPTTDAPAGQYADKGKEAIGENGEVFKVNMDVIHAKYGPAVITTILPSVNSAKIITTSGETYTVGAKKIKLAKPDAPVAEVFGDAKNVGENGIDPVNGKLFIMAKENTKVFVGSNISYTKKGETFTGQVTNLYPSSQQVKVTWDADSEGQAPVKKVSQLVAIDDQNKSVAEAVAEVEAVVVPEVVEEPKEPSAEFYFFNEMPAGYTVSNGRTTYQKTGMGWVEIPVENAHNPVYSSNDDLAVMDLPESAWTVDQSTTNLTAEEVDNMPNGSYISSEKLGITFYKDDDGDWGEDSSQSSHGEYDYYASKNPVVDTYVTDDWTVELGEDVPENNMDFDDLDNFPVWTELYNGTTDDTFKKLEDGYWENISSSGSFESSELLDTYPSEEWSAQKPEIDSDEYMYADSPEDLMSEGEVPVGSVFSYTDDVMSQPEFAVKVNDDTWVMVDDADGNPAKHSHELGKYAVSDSYMKLESEGSGTIDKYDYVPDLVQTGENAFELTEENLAFAPVGAIAQFGSTFVKNFANGWFAVTPLGNKSNQGQVQPEKMLQQANKFVQSYSPKPIVNPHAPQVTDDQEEDTATGLQIGGPAKGLNPFEAAVGTAYGFAAPKSGKATIISKSGKDKWNMEVDGSQFHVFSDQEIADHMKSPSADKFILTSLGGGVEEPVDPFPETLGDFDQTMVDNLPVGAIFFKDGNNTSSGETLLLRKKENGLFEYSTAGGVYADGVEMKIMDYVSIFNDFTLDKNSINPKEKSSENNEEEIEQAVTVTEDSQETVETPADSNANASNPLKEEFNDNSMEQLFDAPIGAMFEKSAGFSKFLKKTGNDEWQFVKENGEINVGTMVYDTDTVKNASLYGYKLKEGTAVSFESLEKEKFNSMTNVEKVEYQFNDMPATWGEATMSKIPVGAKLTYTTAYGSGAPHTWTKLDEQQWQHIDDDGDSSINTSAMLSNEYKFDADAWEELKFEQMNEAKLADGLEVEGLVLSSGTPLADVSTQELLDAKPGSIIQMNKNSGAIVGKFVKKSSDSWYYVPEGQESKSPTPVKSADFTGVLGSSSHVFTVNPEEPKADEPVEADLPDEDLFYTKHVKVTGDILDSYPVGTVLKREGYYHSWDEKYYYVKNGTNDWTKFKVNAQKITKEQAYNYNFSGGAARYAVSIPNPEKVGTVLATGEIAYEGDTVIDVNTNSEFTVAKILKTGINLVDSDGNKSKGKPKDLSKNPEHTTPDQSPSNNGPKVSYDNPVATYAIAQKAKEDAEKLLAEFAGASATEYNKQGMDVKYSDGSNMMNNGLEIAPKTAVDPNNPLYGTEQPVAPTAPSSYPAFKKPSENLPKWDSASWLEKVEERYAANPNKAKATVQESNKWNTIKSVLEGDKDHLSSLLNSKYLDQEMHDEAKAAIDKHNADMVAVKKEKEAENDKAYAEYLEKKSEYLKEYSENVVKYDSDLKNWTAANPMEDAIDPVIMPQASTTPYVDGEDTGDLAPVGTLTSNAAVAGVKADKTLANKGLSFAVDSDMIEDFDVEVMRVIDSDGVEKLEYNFKVTAAHGPVVAATMTTLSPKVDNSIWMQYKTLDKSKGLMKNHNGQPPGGGWTSSGKRYTAKVDNATVVFQKSSESKFENMNVNSSDNSMRVLLPLDSTAADFKNILKSLQINNAPSTGGDIRVMAENKILRAFMSGANYVGNKNVGGEQRVKDLQAIEKKFGVTADNVVFVQNSNGKLKVVLDEETTKKLAARYSMKSFIHSFSDPNTITSVVSGPNAGLLSTYHRWTHGVNGTGQSSSQDINYGSGDYVYITAWQGSKSSHSGAHIHPEAIISRLDTWANPSDNYGKKGHNNAPQELLDSHDYVHEILPKDSVPLKDIQFIRVHASLRAEIVEKLKKAGITSINGLPVDQFIIADGDPVPPFKPWTGVSVVNSQIAEQIIEEVAGDII